MAKRVEFKGKDGKVKNMERPLAQRLEARGQGEILGDILTREETLVAREKDLAKREKALPKQSNKQDKTVLNNK